MVFKWPVCSLSRSIGWKLGLCSPESWCAAVQSVGRYQCNVFAIRFLSCTVRDSFQTFLSSPFSPTLKTIFCPRNQWNELPPSCWPVFLFVFWLSSAYALPLFQSWPLVCPWILVTVIYFFHPTLTRSKHCSFLSARFAQSLKIFNSLGKMGYAF